MDDFTQYNGRLEAEKKHPLCLHLKTLFHLCLCLETTASFFFLIVPAAFFMLQKQKYDFLKQKNKKKSRVIETTHDSHQKGPPEHKIEENVATRKRGMKV